MMKRSFVLPRDVQNILFAIHEKELKTSVQMAEEACVTKQCMHWAINNIGYKPRENNYDLLCKYAKNYGEIKPLKSIKVLISEVMCELGVNQKELTELVGFKYSYISQTLGRSDKRGSKVLRDRLNKLKEGNNNED